MWFVMKRFLSSLLLILFLGACQNKATGEIQGVVFFDKNSNGIRDSDEKGSAGVLVELLLGAQNLRTYTSSSGYFNFPEVPVGPEEVLVTPPASMRITTANAKTRVNVVEDQSTNLLIGIGNPINVGSVIGTVFQDTNANGIREQDEIGVANILVDLLTSVGTVVTVETNNDGVYLANSIVSGDVAVRLRESCGVKPSLGTSRITRVFVGDISPTEAFGITPIKGRVNGRIFQDVNGNGVQDAGELGLPGWTVYNDANNNGQYEIGETATTTCKNGNYALEGVPDSNLKIRHVMNLGYSSSQAVNLTANEAVKPFIVGGQPAPEAAYPFMVAMLRASQPDPNNGQFCGGSLIAPHWVLSAAHCVVKSWDANGTPTDFLQTSELDIMLGSNRLENPVTRIRAAQIIVHPNYNAITQDYDIALVKLSSDSSLATIQPLSPSEIALAATGSSARVIGWGNQSSTVDNYPIDLKQANVPIVDQNTCNAAYTGISARMICAGFPQGGIDSCQGDSGGPLLVSSGLAGVWRQAGLVSFGEGCALPKFPGVYTRVSEFNTYLETQLGRGLASQHDIGLQTGQTLNGISFAVRQTP
jgi:secreted trypsin-like serine protease